MKQDDWPVEVWKDCPHTGMCHSLSLCLSHSPTLPKPVCAFSTHIFSLNKHLIAPLLSVSLQNSFSKVTRSGDLQQVVRAQRSHSTATIECRWVELHKIHITCILLTRCIRLRDNKHTQFHTNPVLLAFTDLLLIVPLFICIYIYIEREREYIF